MAAPGLEDDGAAAGRAAPARFATVHSDGRHKTFVEYNPAPETVPDGLIPLTDEQWAEWQANHDTRAWRDGKLAPCAPGPAAARPTSVDKLAVVDRLGAAGLLRPIRAALKLGRPDTELTDAELLLRDRWDAAASFGSDDAELRGLVTAAGGDPELILAPAPAG